MEIRNGFLVGLAPDSSPRLYENNWSWDAGSLAISMGHLYYWGEEARFALGRDQIKGIALGPGPVGWFKNSSVYIVWQDPTESLRRFNLRPLRVASMLQMAGQTAQLAGELENWHRGNALPARSLLSSSESDIPGMASFDVPGFNEVTSTSPRGIVRGNSLSRIFLLDTFTAAAIAVLFGLSFDGAFFYVLSTIWIIRALQLWPLRRYRATHSIWLRRRSHLCLHANPEVSSR